MKTLFSMCLGPVLIGVVMVTAAAVLRAQEPTVRRALELPKPTPASPLTPTVPHKNPQHDQSLITQPRAMKVPLGPSVAAMVLPPPQAIPAETGTRVLTRAEVETFFTDPKGLLMTDWLEMADQYRTWKRLVDMGYYAVVLEGKTENGRELYRKGYKHLKDFYPDAKRLKWYSRTGMSTDAFNRRLIERYKEGYAPIKLHSFPGNDGQPVWMGVWVKLDQE